MEREQVLCEYRQADADKRLSLFLSYRELREEFSDIDQETAESFFSISRPGRSCSKRSCRF